jgi:hypothetical protein
VPFERCSTEEQLIEYCVDGRVMTSDVVGGDLRSHLSQGAPYTISLNDSPTKDYHSD